MMYSQSFCVTHYKSWPFQCMVILHIGLKYISPFNSIADRQHFLNLRAKRHWTESDKMQPVSFSNEILSGVCVSSSLRCLWVGCKSSPSFIILLLSSSVMVIPHHLEICHLNLSFSIEEAWCRSRTFFWGLTFTKPYFLSSPPPFTSTLIPIFGALPSFSTPRPLCPSILIILWLYLFFPELCSSGRISDRKGLCGGANVG